MQTIQETIKQLHGSLRDYIEATYHISASPLIEQRKELLNRPEVIHQIPYIESTPRYQTGNSFSTIEGLPPAALNRCPRRRWRNPWCGESAKRKVASWIYRNGDTFSTRRNTMSEE